MRRKGSRNKGYWYRSGRGWYVNADDGKALPLRDDAGRHIKAADVARDVLEQAHARYLIARKERAKQTARGADMPVLEVCRLYLDYSKAEDKAATYTTRADFLFDFCFGLPPRFRDKGSKPPKPTKADYRHAGYGRKTVAELIPHDVDEWLAAHETWKSGTRRVAIQSVKRALNWAVGRRLIPASPLKGYSVPKGRRRVTYFPPEIEKELYLHASKPLALAIHVCIRTGARPGEEFCNLTARHVHETPKGQIWKFAVHEHKTGKQTGRERIIYVAPEIAEIVRPLVKKYPTGGLFRNRSGQPWNYRALRSAFLLLKKRLAKRGIKLDPDDCMYSCRHTFAQRTLAGYWTGKQATIEQLALLMGNSRQVAWEHYGQWCSNYTDPLWEAVNGSTSPK